MTITPFEYKQVAVFRLVVIQWQRLCRNSRMYTLYTHNATLWQSFAAAATLSWSRESGDSTFGVLVSSISFSQLFISSHAASWFPLKKRHRLAHRHPVRNMENTKSSSVNTVDIVEINKHQSVELLVRGSQRATWMSLYPLLSKLKKKNLAPSSSRRPRCE